MVQRVVDHRNCDILIWKDNVSKNKKDDKKGAEPPSLFDNLDLFAPVAPQEKEDVPASEDVRSPKDGKAKAAVSVNPVTSAVPSPHNVPVAPNGLTGHGPMRELFDFNFRQYSAYVICDRAIPAVEDGFKPVQRRIMHSLWEKDDGKYTKVANIVGHAMQYHPHGDASIGDAIVVLANKLWGEGNGYLIDGQGNFGSIYTGMPHAATRYIECQLTDLARKEVFNKKTTEFVPNYDGRKEEPVYLPAKIPLLLMLGADGIAVGLSTSILPHNFIELLEAEINLIQKKPVDMSGVHWNYEGAFTFDGEEKCVELAGLPDTVTVTYTNNKATNFGDYEAMAVVEAKDPANYEAPAPVSGCWWHIDKGRYDMSEVHWDYEDEFVYDGEEKTVELVGLPDGVKVETYVGNKGVDAGGYIAEAKLIYRHKENYEVPSVPELRWRIAKKKLDLSEIKWSCDEGTTFVYDDKAKEVRLEGVPEDFEVVYTDNCKANAGTYTAKAKLIYDIRNCEAPEIPDLKWSIQKSSFDTSAVRWDYDGPFEYDGTEKHITLKGVPWQIAVRYRDNRATAPGKYTAKAYLTYDSDNYEAPEIETTIDWEITEKE